MSDWRPGRAGRPFAPRSGLRSGESLGGAAGGGLGVAHTARLGLAVLLLAMLALCGCESSQERSAQLEREARRQVSTVADAGLRIARASSEVKVVATQALHGSEGDAAVVTLRNVSTRTLRDVPLEITVTGRAGRVLYRNNTPGLEAALTSVALLAPGASFTWIDDQVQAGEAPTGVSAEAGEGQTAGGPAPQIRMSGVHRTEAAEGPGIAGRVANESGVAQKNLVVYGLARRGGRIVGAGRAVLSEVPAHGSSEFQVLVIGGVHGAQVQASAPATTF